MVEEPVEGLMKSLPGAEVGRILPIHKGSWENATQTRVEAGQLDMCSKDSGDRRFAVHDSTQQQRQQQSRPVVH